MSQVAIPVEGHAAFVARVGSWNLYDLAIRAVRVRSSAQGLGVEVDIVVPEWIGPVRGNETVFTFHCHQVEELELASFSEEDDISEFRFDRSPLPSGRSEGVAILLETHLSGAVLRCFAARVAVTGAASASTRSA